MALDLPENLSAYAPNKTIDSDIVSIRDTTGRQTNFDTIYSDLINNQGKGIKYHKSLDFSNVGMPIMNSKAGTDGTKYLRQFHQTRLYIQDYGGMIAHGKEQSDTSATYLITANLPEQFGYEIGSEWKQPFGAFTNDQVNALLQLGGANAINQFTETNYGNNFPSMNNRISTIKTWNGSKPLSLKLRIPVIDDGHPNDSTTGSGLRTNLVESLEFLGSLCLPKGGKSELGFYQPPPSPYDFTYTHYGKDKQGNYTDRKDDSLSFSTNGNHVRILLQLGGILLVDNVIVESVSVDYPNTKTMIRHWYKEPSTNAGAAGSSYLTPLLATVTINVSTSEAITAQSYSKMLWLKTQKDQGSFSTSNKEMSKLMGDTWDAGTNGLAKLAGYEIMSGQNSYNPALGPIGKKPML